MLRTFAARSAGALRAQDATAGQSAESRGANGPIGRARLVGIPSIGSENSMGRDVDLVEEIAKAICARECGGVGQCKICREASYAPNPNPKDAFDQYIHDGIDHRGVGREYLAEIILSRLDDLGYCVVPKEGVIRRGAASRAGKFILMPME